MYSYPILIIFKHYLPLHGILKDITTLGQSGPGSNGNEGVQSPELDPYHPFSAMLRTLFFFSKDLTLLQERDSHSSLF